MEGSLESSAALHAKILFKVLSKCAECNQFTGLLQLHESRSVSSVEVNKCCVLLHI